MANTKTENWSVKRAVILGVVCFGVGFLFGFVGHGPKQRVSAPVPGPSAQRNATNPATSPPITPSSVSTEQLRQASEKATSPMLEQLKAEPKNFKLLVQAADMYYQHQAFDKAAQLYNQALSVQDDVEVRDQYATSLFYLGDSRSADEQYKIVLKKSPTNDIALFNEGMIEFNVHHDSKSAIAHWKKILAAYPNHAHKDAVQQMIEKASHQGQ